MNFETVCLVAAGGAIATLARYFVAVGSTRLFGTGFPVGTLIINVTGSFLIGLLIGLFASRWSVSEPIRAFLVVGICGGYTTFSTFSLDIWYLVERGAAISAALYLVASVGLSLAALIGAISLSRML